jgi:uncharacterized membrane-anchored protein
LFTLYIVADVASAGVSVFAFFQYIRMRMADRPVPERKWMTVHFLSLALFVFFGVLILVHLTNKLNGQHQI